MQTASCTDHQVKCRAHVSIWPRLVLLEVPVQEATKLVKVSIVATVVEGDQELDRREPTQKGPFLEVNPR